MEDRELLLTTCRNPQQYSACLYDPLTGNILHGYKNGGTVASKTVTFIGDDYLLTADEDKPMTHLWPLNCQEPDKKLTTILPDKISAMDVGANYEYLAAGIGVRLYVWLLPSGKLFTIQKRNFQPISCVKFTNDGHCVLVGGQDGMLVVYKLVSLVSLHSNLQSQSDGQVEPLYTKQDHSLPITDIHVGQFGDKSRFVTISSDNTCKMYCLSSGKLLLNLVFEEPLSACVFDGPCWNLFIGTNSGQIQQFLLKEPPKTNDHHVSDLAVFQGHSKRVTCLALGIFNGLLFSGSEDNFVFVWEIASRQILRRIEHKGAITNVKCILRHNNFFKENFKVQCVVKTLDRDLIQTEDFVYTKIQNYDIELSDDECGGEMGAPNEELVSENARLKEANRQLYGAAIKLSQKYNNF